MMRSLTTSAVLLAALATTLNAQQPRTPPQNPPQGQQPAQGQAPGARPAQPEGPKPYRDVIPATAVPDSGVFIVYRINDKLFYEIPRAMVGRDFLWVSDQRGTIRGVRYAGEQITDRVVRWERLGNRVFLRLVSYDAQNVEQTRMEATKIDKKKLDDSRFVVPPDFQVVDLAAMFGGLPGMGTGKPGAVPGMPPGMPRGLPPGFVPPPQKR
jgi:hypothetical protein